MAIELIKSKIFKIEINEENRTNDLKEYSLFAKKLIEKININLTDLKIPVIDCDKPDLKSDFPKRIFLNENFTIRIWASFESKKGINARISLFEHIKESL